jgi:murein DD-endopeptidase MepM/ murein hydrolase activator NlpD
VASLAGVVSLGVLTAPTAQADDHKLKDRQKHVQSQIHRASRDLDESSARMRRAAAAVQAAKDQLDQARRELDAAKAKRDAAALRDQQMQEKLQQAEERLAQTQSDLVQGQQAVSDQRDQVTDTVTSIYEQGDPQLLAFSSMLDAQSPADLTRRMEANNVIVGRETRAYDSLHAAEVLLQVREDEVQQARDDVEVQRKAAAQHLVVMRQLVDQTHAAQATVREKVQSRRDAKKLAVQAHQKDRAQLRTLQAHEHKIKERILRQARRAALRAARRHHHVGYRGSTGGFLEVPVANTYVTSPFGWREHPIYHYWGLHDGDDFHAPCGTPLRAAGTGTVMSEYYSSVWGNRLYLNLGIVNGKNVTVIYNHLTRYAVGRGGHVARGQVVGYAGTTGWSTGCHLHFTVMVNGTAVDPQKWF